jgi:hypothetical protein
LDNGRVGLRRQPAQGRTEIFCACDVGYLAALVSAVIGESCVAIAVGRRGGVTSGLGHEESRRVKASLRQALGDAIEIVGVHGMYLISRVGKRLNHAPSELPLEVAVDSQPKPFEPGVPRLLRRAP